MSDVQEYTFDDFLALDDVKYISKETQEMLNNEREERASMRAAEQTEQPEEHDDSDDYDEMAFDGDWQGLTDDFIFEDEQSEEESDSEEETSDETEESTEENYVDDEDYEQAYAVDLDDVVEINGQHYTIEDLYNRYREDDLFNKERETFNQEREAFNKDKELSAQLLELNTLECDKQLAEYAYFDWDWYAQNDQAGYIENKRYLEKIQKRKQDLIQEQSRMQSEKETADKLAFIEKSRACVAVLEKEIPGWNMNRYQSLMDHAVDFYGADREQVEKWNDPSIFLMLNHAYCAHNDILKAKAKIVREKKNGKFLRPGAKALKESEQAQDSKALAKMKRDFNSGKLKPEQVFDFLED